MIDTVIDLSYGDCGKARICDALLASGKYSAIARFGGSSNSGHSIVFNGKKYITRIMPSGILHDDIELIIGNGVLLDVDVLLKEIDQFLDFGVLDRLALSDKAHLLLPYHKLVDAKTEKATNSKIGSTKNGVAYCAQDKVGRRGIRLCDVMNGGYHSLITESLKYWEKAFKLTNEESQNAYNESIALIDKLLEINSHNRIVYNMQKKIDFMLSSGKSILAEASQGSMIDINTGSYPFVTSTDCNISGMLSGLGVNHKQIGEVCGLIKAYTTRVGNGPFETELMEASPIAKAIRDNGNEYGSVTGRPRRVGWLNLDETKNGIRINGVDYFAMTKVDVLYNIDDVLVLNNGKYECFAGWKSIDGPSFKTYVKYIEEQCNVPIKFISFGADRNDMITR